MSDRVRSLLVRWGPAIVVEALIVVAVLLPASSVPEGPEALSVLFHVGAHGLLGLLLVQPGRLTNGWAVVAVGLASGLVTEALQATLTSSRSADPWDVVADVAGAGIGWFIAVRRDRP